MTTHDQADEPQDAAAAAFARLEGEIAVMRRAVESLATEKANIDIPDYNATLGEMAQHLESAITTLEVIVAKPAMDLTPENMAQRFEQAARQGRQTDREHLSTSQNRYDNAVRELRGLVVSAKHADDQREHMIWAAAGGVLAGCLLWAIVPGPVARALPKSWYVPEKIATRALGEPSTWDGGVRLLQVGSPEAWRAISAAAEMRHQNRGTIAACERTADKSKRPVICKVKVKPRGGGET